MPRAFRSTAPTCRWTRSSSSFESRDGRTVEIKTGSRRMIGYLLLPLAKYKRESLRER